jgi:hypothetical protein
MRRWHVVHTLAKTLSPAAEAFRYFILENGEAFLARHFAHVSDPPQFPPPRRHGAPQTA